MGAAGTPRGDATRARILQSARDQFAERGYQRATIRSIAQDAAIDPSLVMRYYGNKSRLFDAAADLDLRLPDLAGQPTSDLGGQLVGHFLTRWEDDDADALLVMLRSAATDETAADRMREMFAGQLVSAIRPIIQDGSTAEYRAGLVATQMLGLALCRYILRLPPMAGASARALTNQLGPTIGHYLTMRLGDETPAPTS